MTLIALLIALTFSLPDSTFTNLTEIVFDVGVAGQVMEFGVDFQGLLNFIPDVSIGPLETFSFSIHDVIADINRRYNRCKDNHTLSGCSSFDPVIGQFLDGSSWATLADFLQPIIGLDLSTDFALLPIDTAQIDTWLSPDIFNQQFSVNMPQYVANSFTVSPLRISSQGVSEPSILLLIGSGLVGMGFSRRRFRK